MRGRNASEWSLTAASALALLLASTRVDAGHGIEAAPGSASMTVARAAGSLLDADCGRLDCAAEFRGGRLSLETAPSIRAALVEFPVFDPTGRPRRPQHGIGLRSAAMESALKGIGIDARVCFAPVLRMHTKLGSGFDLSGTLLVTLRCSLF